MKFITKFFSNAAAVASLTAVLATQDRAVSAHMDEREELLDTIYDLEAELADNDDAFEQAAIALTSQQQEIFMLNELLVEGSAKYDFVIEKASEMFREADANIAALTDEVRSTAEADNRAKQEIAGYREDYLVASDKASALEAANRQSQSYVKQAVEALAVYGIEIDDTPVGPAVRIDREAFINQIALDNLAIEQAA